MRHERAFTVAACLTFCAASPLGVLLAGPLALGAPHVAADVACLLRVGGLRRARFLLAVAGPLAILTGLQVAGLFGWRLPAAVPLPLFGALAVAGAAFSAGGLARPRAAWLAVAALAWAAASEPKLLTLALAHGHNLFGVGLWLWLMARAGKRPDVAAGAACLLGLAAILGGALDFASSGGPVAGLSWETMERALAPGVPRPWAGRLVLSFAFLQAVHYAVWLRWMPGELIADGWKSALGTPALGLIAAAAVAMLLAGARDPVGARDAYLALASFHAWLELSAAAHLAAG